MLACEVCTKHNNLLVERSIPRQLSVIMKSPVRYQSFNSLKVDILVLRFQKFFSEYDTVTSLYFTRFLIGIQYKDVNWKKMENKQCPCIPKTKFDVAHIQLASTVK